MATHLVLAVDCLVTKALAPEALRDRVTFSKSHSGVPTEENPEVLRSKTMVHGGQKRHHYDRVAVWCFPMVSKFGIVFAGEEVGILGVHVFANVVEVVVHTLEEHGARRGLFFRQFCLETTTTRRVSDGISQLACLKPIAALDDNSFLGDRLHTFDPDVEILDVNLFKHLLGGFRRCDGSWFGWIYVYTHAQPTLF